MDHAAPVRLVEEPRAHARAAERTNALEIHATRRERVECLDRIIAALHADDADGRTPEPRGEREEQRRAARFAHARAAVGIDDVVDQQIAEADEIGRHAVTCAFANATATARTREGSSAFDHTPPCFTDEPTISPSASE